MISFGAMIRAPLTKHRSLAIPAPFFGLARPTLFTKPARKMPQAETYRSATQGATRLQAGVIALVACFCAFVQTVPAHAQQHKHKVPIIGKMTSNPHQQAYSGKVQSLDLKQKILSVISRQGQDTEIFPLKKSVHVESINGKKMKLNSLTPGTNILIYYDEKGGERMVKNIIVLEAGKSKGETKHAPAT